MFLSLADLLEAQGKQTVFKECTRAYTIKAQKEARMAMQRRSKLSIPGSKVIRIDAEIYAWLQTYAEPLVDTPNSVLHKIMKIVDPVKKEDA